ncbi:cobalamin biosynthesis protein CbiD [delta proteobacterium NaphS2]|nr:cobalamin biosynthesis protein CbiD [delta proteobacterium NaphS2]
MGQRDAEAGKRLREGFTTGSAAAAGAKAALGCLVGLRISKEVEIPLPAGGRLTIPVERVERVGNAARAVVRKDGGDDPDATHKARIMSTVRLLPGGRYGDVHIEGGTGVGKVTRPGLPVPVGESAINPAPRRQIREALLECLNEAGVRSGVSVVVEVANGERIARKTLNPRLGILGGISILGTRGTVKPFSNKAYKDTITMSMDVAKAEGLKAIVLSTGGRSERFLKELLPGFPETAFIQVADFFSFSFKEAAKRGFHHIFFSCFFGKLVKMAQGFPYTHARKSTIDFDRLASWSVLKGMEKERAHAIKGANTAREALSIIQEAPRGDGIIRYVLETALISARGFAGPLPDITYYLFDFGGVLLLTEKSKGRFFTKA